MNFKDQLESHFDYTETRDKDTITFQIKKDGYTSKRTHHLTKNTTEEDIDLDRNRFIIELLENSTVDMSSYTRRVGVKFVYVSKPPR